MCFAITKLFFKTLPFHLNMKDYPFFKKVDKLGTFQNVIIPGT